MLTGSVSCGTLRAQDLIPRFLDILSEYFPTAYSEIVTAPDPLPPSNAVNNDSADWWYSDECHEFIGELIDLLNDCAMDGYYFGSHPGDGADYGFWPIDVDF